MRGSRLAVRYAKSLLDIALEKGVLEEVHGDMKELLQICRESREFELLLKSPIVRQDKKMDIINKSFQGKFNQLSMMFIEVVARKKRENFLKAIASEFLNQYKIHNNITTAQVTTAFPMDDKLRDKVKKLVAGEKVDLIEKVDESLIGGLILKVGDKEVDSSIKNRIEELRLSFSKNLYISEL